jgi:DNA invertase Pin-like site-specific DNA recombinase
MNRKLVAYYRVSTTKQGISKLGLEGQEASVEGYARANGDTIIKAYHEVESGRKCDRPELTKALAHAKRSRAVLCIARLDRLTRNVAFLANLMESGVEFVAVDQPHATPFTIHILAAVAEHEAKMISARTKSALAAYTARGGKLGTDNLTDGGRARGAKRGGQTVKAKADAAYMDIGPTVVGLRGAGHSLAEIAALLNSDGHTSRTGKALSKVQIGRILKRQGVSS